MIYFVKILFYQIVWCVLDDIQAGLLWVTFYLLLIFSWFLCR